MVSRIALPIGGRDLPQPHAWTLAVLVDEDHPRFLQREAEKCPVAVASITSPFKSADGDGRKARRLAKLRLGPIQKGAGRAAL